MLKQLIHNFFTWSPTNWGAKIYVFYKRFRIFTNISILVWGFSLSWAVCPPKIAKMYVFGFSQFWKLNFDKSKVIFATLLVFLKCDMARRDLLCTRKSSHNSCVDNLPFYIWMYVIKFHLSHKIFKKNIASLRPFYLWFKKIYNFE